MAVPSNFSAMLTARVPNELLEGIGQAAKACGQSASAFVRQAILDRLNSTGTGMPRQWALVRNGRLYVDDDGNPSISGFVSEAPESSQAGDECLPIENTDSEPFNPQIHWRGKPSYLLSGDRVLRLYPIIRKCEGE